MSVWYCIPSKRPATEVCSVLDRWKELMTDPLVTCICITRDRRDWLPQAIRCFRAQTYRRKELLIVGDSAEDVQGIDQFEGLMVTHLLAGNAPIIGAKRNAAIGLARGKLIAHWDDDDFSAPGRLSNQVA